MDVGSMSSENKTFLICPRCYSRDISYLSNTIGIVSAAQYRCRECDYVSELFPQVDKEEYKKIKEEKN